MKGLAIAALSVVIVLPAQAARQSVTPALSCDNEGRCTTLSVAAAPVAKIRTSPGKTRTGTMSTDISAGAPQTAVKVVVTSEAVTSALDASGNKAPGVVVSSKTGARARVGIAYAARFQAYI